MNIYGFISESFQDDERGLTSVIFTPGCNFSCPACHAKKIIEGKNSFDEKEIIELLERRAKQYELKRLTISGGEPTLQKDLIDFLKKCKNIELLVKLDTNGSNPEKLQELLEEKLVNYVAMDIKGPERFYGILAGRKVNIKEIEESIKLVQKFPDYEFRTTIVPIIIEEKINYELWKKEYIEDMAKWTIELINKESKYFLQSFQAREKGEIVDDRLSKEIIDKDMEITPKEIMNSVYSVMIKYFPNTKIR